MPTANPKLKRKFSHDYHSPSIYLVTDTVLDRKSVLNAVEGSVEQPKVKLTEVGKAVKQEIFAIEKRYPQIKVLFNIIMPDHVHLVLHVKEQLSEKMPLGNVMTAWEQACGKAYSALLAPWPYHNNNRKITREQCHQLNEMAELLANAKK